ncbi:hypothetical protein BCR35DRAFT_328050 [Leucosporidium creatinivorum]|uniref:Nucleoporin protein Ndc1-Nup n=1 Tax=Leucosporidium creatinivorum TaxID=106004 RepID=A0A1Y2G4V2_9BASI|nr:hypothetical protein BCR35DRAFT_328050 [Leucosporidium creatinivorum]
MLVGFSVFVLSCYLAMAADWSDSMRAQNDGSANTWLRRGTLLLFVIYSWRALICAILATIAADPLDKILVSPWRIPLLLLSRHLLLPIASWQALRPSALLLVTLFLAHHDERGMMSLIYAPIRQLGRYILLSQFMTQLAASDGRMGIYRLIVLSDQSERGRLTVGRVKSLYETTEQQLQQEGVLNFDISARQAHESYSMAVASLALLPIDRKRHVAVLLAAAERNLLCSLLDSDFPSLPYTAEQATLHQAELGKSKLLFLSTQLQALLSKAEDEDRRRHRETTRSRCPLLAEWRRAAVDLIHLAPASADRRDFKNLDTYIFLRTRLRMSQVWSAALEGALLEEILDLVLLWKEAKLKRRASAYALRNV